MHHELHWNIATSYDHDHILFWNCDNPEGAAAACHYLVFPTIERSSKLHKGQTDLVGQRADGLLEGIKRSILAG